MEYNYLTPEQERIIISKVTEVPFTIKYATFFEEGTFICRKYNAPLFLSKDMFNSLFEAERSCRE
jgi:peptide methionine sulfoxide reductase MsrB